MTQDSQSEYATDLVMVIGAQDSQSEHRTHLAMVIGSGMGT